MATLNTRVVELDREHQFFMALISPFQSERTSSWSLDRLRVLLAEVRRFVRLHFRTEEMLMTTYAYLDSRAHIAEHREMERKIDEFVLQAEVATLDPARVRSFLYEWFLRHTTVIDLPLLEHVSRARCEQSLGSR